MSIIPPPQMEWEYKLDLHGYKLDLHGYKLDLHGYKLDLHGYKQIYMDIDAQLYLFSQKDSHSRSDHVQINNSTRRWYVFSASKLCSAGGWVGGWGGGECRTNLASVHSNEDKTR